MYNPQYGVPQQGMQQVPYGMPGIQAAAMAATAAASGSNYNYMHSDPNAGKKEGRSPPRMGNVAGARRMSQVGGSNVMAHGQRAGGMAQSSDVPAAAAVEESPLYVNAKQFHRILKRRVARQKLEEQLRLTAKGRKPYLHESRHNHAMRRPRGPGGRFLTAEEVATLERDGKLDFGEDGVIHKQPTPDTGGTKRKSEAPKGQSKKARTEEKEQEADDENDDDDEAASEES